MELCVSVGRAGTKATAYRRGMARCNLRCENGVAVSADKGVIVIGGGKYEKGIRHIVEKVEKFAQGGLVIGNR